MSCYGGILLVYPRFLLNPHPYPPKTVPLAAGAGFQGYGCGFPWKTPGLPVPNPKGNCSPQFRKNNKTIVSHKTKKNNKVWHGT